MRVASLLLLASVSLSSGCSLMIAGSGKDLGSLTTKEQVHAQFGDPSATGVREGGKVFEDFHTRQKLSTWDQNKAEGYVMLMAMTLGVSELVLTPYELYLLGVRTLIGQTVHVTYDANGKIVRMDLDGKPMPQAISWITTNPDLSQALSQQAVVSPHASP